MYGEDDMLEGVSDYGFVWMVLEVFWWVLVFVFVDEVVVIWSGIEEIFMYLFEL